MSRGQNCHRGFVFKAVNIDLLWVSTAWSYESDVQFIVAEELQKLSRVILGESDFNLWVMLVKGPHDRGHNWTKDGGTGKADAKLTHLTFRAEQSDMLRSFSLLYYRPRFRKKRLPCARQLSAARKAVEDWTSQFGF